MQWDGPSLRDSQGCDRGERHIPGTGGLSPLAWRQAGCPQRSGMHPAHAGFYFCPSGPLERRYREINQGIFPVTV